MGVQDITADAVLAAINAGDDDIFTLADAFGVPFTSHTLRSTVAALVEADRLVVVNPDADRRDHRRAVA
jgi:hypothetical protein